MLEKILLSQSECVILGDFNLPNIDWTLQKPTPTPSNKQRQLLSENNITQHVHEITWQKAYLGKRRMNNEDTITEYIVARREAKIIIKQE